MFANLDILLINVLIPAAAVSGLLSWLLARRGRRLRDRRRPSDLCAVQASHTTEVPRLGGIAIFLGFLAAVLASGIRSHDLVLLGSGLIVFLAGVGEDLCGNISARRRLVASLVAAVTAIVLSGTMIARLDLGPLDPVFSALPVAAIFLTVLLSAAYTHAFNLIDGVNGLSSLVGISTALGLAWAADLHGQSAISMTALLMAAAILGFSVLNWPQGKLFLGDGGAYFIGHGLFWIAVMLAARAPLLNVPAIMLMMFWPIAEMTITIARRAILRIPLGRPDRLHIHHVVLRGIEILTSGRRIRPLANALTTVVVLPAVVLPPLLGATLTHDRETALAVFAACLAAYGVSYVFLLWFVSRPQARRILAIAEPGPAAARRDPAWRAGFGRADRLDRKTALAARALPEPAALGQRSPRAASRPPSLDRPHMVPTRSRRR